MNQDRFIAQGAQELPLRQPLGAAFANQQGNIPIPKRMSDSREGFQQHSLGHAGAVPLVGAQQGAPPQAPPVPMSPQMGAPQPPMQQAPPPQAQPHMGAFEEEGHLISIRGIAPDGNEMVAEYVAAFPKGTKILGVSERLSY